MEIALHFTLKCMKCEYKNNFLTQKIFGRSFEINQGIVYSMRSGQGYISIEKINGLPNIPPPMTKNNYETLTNNIALFAKVVTEETMKGAAIKMRSSKNMTPS